MPSVLCTGMYSSGSSSKFADLCLARKIVRETDEYVLNSTVNSDRALLSTVVRTYHTTTDAWEALRQGDGRVVPHSGTDSVFSESRVIRT
jgi:hypothetical protein